MKQSRLLEIIREEISATLNEVGQSPEEAKATNLSIQAEKAKIAAAQKQLQQLQKSGVSEAEELEEDQLNEMAYDIIVSQPNELAKLQDKIKDSTKKGEQKLAKALEIIQKTKKEGKPIRQRDIANEMGVIQQEINPLINKLIDVGILEKGESVTGVTKKKVTDKAQGRPASEKSKAEPKAKAEKAPKAKAEKAEPEDGEDKEAIQSMGSDSTAKDLGKIAYSKKLTPEEETQYETALKGIQAKIKRIEDGEEKPDDRTLLKKAYQNSEIQRLFKAKGSSLNDILKGIIG